MIIETSLSENYMQATGGEPSLTRNIVGAFLKFLGPPQQPSEAPAAAEVRKTPCTKNLHPWHSSMAGQDCIAVREISSSQTQGQQFARLSGNTICSAGAKRWRTPAHQRQ